MARGSVHKTVIFTFFSSILLQSCNVPRDMHVTYGLNPKRVDDDVRFRTTYYFRTFDYCWDADVRVSQLEGQNGIGVPYRDIIPQTDNLYRYRMTGKASSLFSRIRFESGVLKASEINAFGTQITYSHDADGFYVRSNTEVKEAAERGERAKAERADQLARIETLIAQFRTFDPDKDLELRRALLPKITEAFDKFASSASVATSATSGQITSLTTSVNELKAAVAAVDARVKTLGSETAETHAMADKLVAKAEEAVAAARTLATLNRLADCPIGEKVRKGFQIMGPEGVKTFDQDDRLVLAMSSSAKPLIETLQEYSGRFVASRVDVTAQMLSIAQENLRAEAARRALSDTRSAKADATAILQAALIAFDGKPKGDKP